MRRSRVVAAAITIVILVSSGGAVARDDRGYGPWRLGMSKTAVREIPEFAPYREVVSTGGLETSTGVFEGHRTKLSFVFGGGGLKKIQIWAYEGPSVDAAIDSWYRVRQYLSPLYGVVEIAGADAAVDAGCEDFATSVTGALEAQPRSGVVRMQMAPVTMPQYVSVFSSLFRHPQHGYFVFVYYQDP